MHLDWNAVGVAVRACVDEQVVHDPAEERSVEWQREGLGAGGRVNRDGGGSGRFGRTGAKPVDEGARLLAEIREAGARHVEQVAEDPVHGDELLFDVVERARRGTTGWRIRRQSIAGDLERDTGTPEGGPQLVTDGAEELPLAAHHRLDAIGHAVEADGHLADFEGDPSMPAPDVRPEREVPAAEPVGCMRELLEGPCEQVGHASRHEREDRHDQDEREDETPPRPGPGVGPELLHLERPDQRSLADDRDEDVLRVLRDDGSPSAGRVVHASTELAWIADQAHVEAGDVAHLADVRARRFGLVPGRREPDADVACHDLRTRDWLRARTDDDDGAGQDGKQDGPEEPGEQAGPQRPRAVHSAILIR